MNWSIASEKERKNVSEEDEVLLAQSRLQEEEEVSKILEQQTRSWETAEKKLESIAEEARRMTQSSDTEGKNRHKTGTLCRASPRKKDGPKTKKTWPEFGRDSRRELIKIQKHGGKRDAFSSQI